ncbi:MAG: helix-turn-helix transcriptional regulator [Saprospiraceae bacterium]|nr:helix-turn-helix transcriptional regulator [Saprospiraceae bacterium]
MMYYDTISLISEREKEVLRLVAYEYSSKEIAQELYISTNTVNTHKKNLRSKLDVKNLAGMVRKGFELGILELELRA